VFSALSHAPMPRHGCLAQRPHTQALGAWMGAVPPEGCLTVCLARLPKRSSLAQLNECSQNNLLRPVAAGVDERTPGRPHWHSARGSGWAQWRCTHPATCSCQVSQTGSTFRLPAPHDNAARCAAAEQSALLFASHAAALRTRAAKTARDNNVLTACSMIANQSSAHRP
jgi:hypothetical protein